MDYVSVFESVVFVVLVLFRSILVMRIFGFWVLDLLKF